MHTTHPSPPRAFTLIELMIVVTLVALILTLAGPSIMIWLQNLKVRNVGESFVNGLQLARMEAMRRNTRVTFSMVSGTDASCTLSATSPSWVVAQGGALPDAISGKCNGEMVDEGGDIIQKNSAGTALKGTIISAVDASGIPTNCLTYDGLGQIPSQGSIACNTPIGRIDISSPASGTVALRVMINQAGQVRLCYPDPDNKLSSTDPRKC